MTGQAREEGHYKNLIVSVEVKSVNHRFKDFKFRMPSELYSLEMKLRNQMNQSFQRGSFDIYISRKNLSEESDFCLDEKKILFHMSRLKELSLKAQMPIQLNSSDLLRNEFLVDFDENEKTELESLVLNVFQLAINSLKNCRENEGNKLVEILRNHLAEFKKNLKKINNLKDGFRSSIEEKLKKRIKENLEMDGEIQRRYLQEVVYYMEKLDICEEIQRSYIHLEKLEEVFDNPNEKGRRIEFLLQELNRETNTIGSKAQNSEITENIVNMKVLLEKMREQALNIE